MPGFYCILLATATVIVLVYVSAIVLAGRYNDSCVFNSKLPIPDSAPALYIAAGVGFAAAVVIAIGVADAGVTLLAGKVPEWSVERSVALRLVTLNVPVSLNLLSLCVNVVAASETSQPPASPDASVTSTGNDPAAFVVVCCEPSRMTPENVRLAGAVIVRLASEAMVRLPVVFCEPPGGLLAKAVSEVPMVIANTAISPAATLRARILFLNIIVFSPFLIELLTLLHCEQQYITTLA